jgi:hypothetical protein
MKRFTATILAMGLAAAVGTASAQTYGTPYYGSQPNYGSQPSVDRYGQASGAYYDYARVLRVDPLINSGYGSYPASGSQRCYTRQDGYAGNDGYYPGNGNGYYGNDGYGTSGYGNGSYGNDGYYGNQQGYGSNTGRTMATVIGGVLGAAIGSQVGGGSARYATSAIGSMVGGIAGRQVYENAQRQRQPRNASVTVCDPVPADGRYYGTGNNTGVSAYDVTYEYGGRSYTTRTNYNPGSRIRVRVDVRPE